MKPPSPSPLHGAAAAVKQPASSPDARLTPSSVVAAAAVGMSVTPPRRSCDDAASCVVNDVDAFARTIASIRSKPAAAAASSSSDGGGGGDHLATVLAHYAARWLPDVASSPSGRFLLPPQSPTATWIRKRLLLESLVAALPPDGGDGDDGGGGVTCDFLLRLLRAGSMAGADAALLADLEARAARRLDQASLGAVMIPAFRAAAGDTPGAGATLLDVPLVLRLVRGFLREGGKAGGGGGAAAACRVARLVDAYLAEAALEAGLRPAEFEELARAVPAHARAADDGLYRAVDTYLKAHPHAGKEERRSLCRLIDARKLTAEAAAHAVQNERLPVRCVVQVLFSEHGSKLTRLAEWTTGSFRSLQSRSPADLITGANGGARCPSKREVAAQHHELRRLREDVSRLQVQCHALQAQVDRLSSERRRRPGGLFKLLFGGGGGGGGGGATGAVVVDDSDSGLDRTPLSRKKGVVVRATTAAAASTPASGTPAVARWRRSHS
uniref:NPH3 domain-containing protein n=1 Tax=Oryza meridionalis TaxID=40149 RepID=A0A0E0EAZ1_9ORYZ